MTITEILDQHADLDSLDTSMDKVVGHLPRWQQGATTVAEMMALARVVAVCGYAYKPTKMCGPEVPVCPKCVAIWGY